MGGIKEDVWSRKPANPGLPGRIAKPRFTLRLFSHTSVFSAFEMSYDNALYKSILHYITWKDCQTQVYLEGLPNPGLPGRIAVIPTRVCVSMLWQVHTRCQCWTRT